jgi:UDP-N-acetylglucosamine 3-dehydrogenase
LKLRVGIIGLGVMGKNHLRVLSQIPDVEVVGILDSRIDEENDFDCKVPFFRDFTELISKKIDYAIVSVPTLFHFDLGMKLAIAGIPALIEKPLTGDFKTAKILVEAFEKNNVLAAVGHVERFNPAIVSAREQIDLVGQIRFVQTVRRGPSPLRVLDVGVTLDLASHDIDLVTWVTGQKYEEVFATKGRFSTRSQDDLLVASGKLSGGATFLNIASWVHHDKERRVAIVGDKGTLVVDCLQMELTYLGMPKERVLWSNFQLLQGDTSGERITFALKKREPLLIQHENFINLILGEKFNNLASLRDGLEVIRIISAIEDSSTSGSIVSL